MNRILNLLQRLHLYWLIKVLTRFGYSRKGKKLKSVNYSKTLKAWIYNLNDFHFISRGAGWVQDFDYLFDNLKKYSCYQYWPAKGDIIIDVGAGVGEETFAFANLVGQEGKVFSIEAHPSTAAILKYGCELNSLWNVKVDNLAISDSNGFITIEDDDEDYLRNTISKSIRSSPTGVQVEAFTLDQFVGQNKIERIDFLKINIEGAEQLMIKGMTQSVQLVKNIAVSCHDFRWAAGESEFYKTREQVHTFLSDNGFNVFEQGTGDAVMDSYLYGIKN